MTPDELDRRMERARTEPMVIARKDGHLSVHSPATGGGPYEVRLEAASPSCTCPDFEKHRHDSDWRCKHILAVQQRAARSTGGTPEREPSTVPPDGPSPLPATAAPTSSHTDYSQMLIKRSVSPDGRIDSLSVEFSCPVNGVEKEVESRAARLLMLQDSIVDRFLKNGRAAGNTGARESQPDPDGAVPATMTSIGGKDGKWGRRLFIRFEVDGRTLWYFGGVNKLKECIVSAGARNFPVEVAEGVQLDLPCRVITKPSDDGRFMNVDRVLPPLSAS